MNKIIGGEQALSLELIHKVKIRDKNERLSSSGRAAFYAILEKIYGDDKEKKKKLLIPDYLCDSLTKTIRDLKAGYIFYETDHSLEPVYDSLKRCTEKNDVAAVLFIYYFGAADPGKHIRRFKEEYPGIPVISDHVQDYYGYFEDEISDYCFTSRRKWFPVPDGAEARAKEYMIEPVIRYENKFAGYKLSGNILKNYEEMVGKENYLKLIELGESVLDKKYLCGASPAGEAIMGLLDIKGAAERRKENAAILHRELKGLGLSHFYREEAVMMCMPVFFEDGSTRDRVRRYLFQNDIFAPIHWNHINNELSGENGLYGRELSLIIDQRYDEEDMLHEIEILKNALKVE